MFPMSVLATVYSHEPKLGRLTNWRLLGLVTLWGGVLLGCPGSACAQADSESRKLIDGWIEAAGGSRVWDSVRTLRYTITTVWYDSTEKEVRRRPRYVWIDKAPRAYRVRVERQEAAGQYVQAWNGQKSWATLNGALLPDSALAVREVPYVTAELVYWMGLPWKLLDPGVRTELVEPGTVHVRFGSGIGLHDGDRYWYRWRDPRSKFPSEVEYIEQGKTENDRNRITWSDWTRFGPAVYAAQRRLVNQNGRTLRAFLVSDIRVNERLPDSLFVQPLSDR